MIGQPTGPEARRRPGTASPIKSGSGDGSTRYLRSGTSSKDLADRKTSADPCHGRQDQAVCSWWASPSGKTTRNCKLTFQAALFSCHFLAHFQSATGPGSIFTAKDHVAGRFSRSGVPRPPAQAVMFVLLGPIGSTVRIHSRAKGTRAPSWDGAAQALRPAEPARPPGKAHPPLKRFRRALRITARSVATRSTLPALGVSVAGDLSY